MYAVVRNGLNTLNRGDVLRLLLRDIPGPDGQPWVGLENRPLKLFWNIAAGDTDYAAERLTPKEGLLQNCPNFPNQIH